MGFLDNLENSLKTLEGREERDPNEHARRHTERSRALAVAPWAERLKTSEYTKRLFEESALAGHRIRAKIYLAWVETTLRLEARGRALELVPAPDGIVARYDRQNGEAVQGRVDLNDDPRLLLESWLAGEKAPVKEPLAEG